MFRKIAVPRPALSRSVISPAGEKLFDKILIANRGEIACRIMRTCKKLGIKTVAVYSEADAHSLHVKSADEVWPCPHIPCHSAVYAICCACAPAGGVHRARTHVVVIPQCGRAGGRDQGDRRPGGACRPPPPLFLLPLMLLPLSVAVQVHPGYGFLSEKHFFAEAVAKAGATFIGPPVPALISMGDKITSKNLAKNAGVRPRPPPRPPVPC